MEQYIFDENNGLWYELHGEQYYPCLTLPAEDELSIGVWGNRHLHFIRKHRKGIYTGLLLSGKLNKYLVNINQQAQDQIDTIIKQMAQAQGVTETLKAANQMEWVGRMNNIRAVAEEIVSREIIYA